MKWILAFFLPSTIFEVIEYDPNKLISIEGENNYNKMLIGYGVIFSAILFIIVYRLAMSESMSILPFLLLLLFFRINNLFTKIDLFYLKEKIVFSEDGIFVSVFRNGRMNLVFPSNAYKLVVRNEVGSLFFYKNESINPLFEFRIQSHKLSDTTIFLQEIQEILKLNKSNESNFYISTFLCKKNKLDHLNYVGSFINKTTIGKLIKYEVSYNEFVDSQSKILKVDLREKQLIYGKYPLLNDLLHVEESGNISDFSDFQYEITGISGDRSDLSSHRVTLQAIYKKKLFKNILIKNLLYFSISVPIVDSTFALKKLNNDISFIVNDLNSIQLQLEEQSK